MPSIRVRTQDPVTRMQYTDGVRRRAIRAILIERLTEKQYRRVALLYGFDGPEMTERKAAEAEEIARGPLRRSRDQALEKLTADWRLWLMWLTIEAGNIFRGPDSYKPGEGAFNEELREAELKRGAASVVNQDGKLEKTNIERERENAPRSASYCIRHKARPEKRELREAIRAGHEFVTIALRPGDDGWESDRYNPSPAIEEAYTDGFMAYVEDPTQENPYRQEDLRAAWQEGYEKAVNQKDMKVE